ncbi:unnamed protein product [Rotaria socialis]|uniref:Uncharacterized protein n=1 Tax=Rotaria socialis TaxID=392032 RepID=A0A817W2X7_9BILA|nr:unnamed protein product [Rotaria socialis]CAF4469100.1 unnamed protein product [Rotaria socialis]
MAHQFNNDSNPGNTGYQDTFQDPRPHPEMMVPQPRHEMVVVQPIQEINLAVHHPPKPEDAFSQFPIRYRPDPSSTSCSKHFRQFCHDIWCNKRCIILMIGIAIFAITLSVALAILLPSTNNARSTQHPTAITNTVSSELTASSRAYIRYQGGGCNFYFDAFQVTVPTIGTYIFSSNSNIDTYGYIYSGSFFPTSPNENLLAQDDQSAGNNQFQLIVNLQSNFTYYLIFTTYISNVIGPYSVTASGPQRANLILTNMTSTETVVNSYAFSTIVLSALNNSNSTLTRCGGHGQSYYYQTFRVTVSSAGIYKFISNSSIDMFGYIYKNGFSPISVATNLLAYDNENAGSSRILLVLPLQSTTTYYLLVTTYSVNVTGPYALIVSGPQRASLVLTSITSPITGFTIYSYYSSALTTNSSTFQRVSFYSNYYYEAIRVTVPNTGTYYFRSNTTVDTYGYLYLNNFDPLSIGTNQIKSDDDSGGNRQFQLSSSLSFDQSYVLVFTTYNPNVITDISIIAWGPNTIMFARISSNS